CDASTSYGASTQSKWVDLLNAAMASAGPPANRPPHSEPSLVPCCSTADCSDISVVLLLQVEVALGGHLRRQAVQLHETAGQGLVEGVALVVGGQVEVVQRRIRATAVDAALAGVHGHADIAGHALLRLLDE